MNSRLVDSPVSFFLGFCGNESRAEHVIRSMAYARFEKRGRRHGLALDDWLAAEAEYNEKRQTAKSSHLLSQCDATIEKVQSSTCLVSISSSDEQKFGRNRCSIQYEKVATLMPDSIWLNDRHVRSSMTSEDFAETFSGFSTILVMNKTDEICAAGNDAGGLTSLISSRGLNVHDFHLEPGPFKLNQHAPSAQEKMPG